MITFTDFKFYPVFWILTIPIASYLTKKMFVGYLIKRTRSNRKDTNMTPQHQQSGALGILWDLRSRI